MRSAGDVESAHRVPRAGGLVAELWHGVQTKGLGPGPDECVARLRAERTWDESRQRARPERFMSAAQIVEEERRRRAIP